MLIGWIQFSQSIRNKNLAFHRLTGKVYVISVLLSSLGGFYIGYFATGGMVPALGFMSLAVVWFYTTLKAYLLIKNKRTEEHKKMMTYSYATCFAAVTLRLWLPVLMMYFQNFTISYSIVAWLCWIPNLIVAYFITRKQESA